MISVFTLKNWRKTTKKSISGSWSAGFSWVGTRIVYRTDLERVVKGEISLLTGKRIHCFLHLSTAFVEPVASALY
jgi:hypothetical protein